MGGAPSKPGDSSRGLEVIGAGYSRTGTVSTQLALEKVLNGPVLHGGTHMITREDGFNRKWVAAYEARRRGDRRLCLKLLRELTRGYVGITDLPGIGFLPELRELYPDARVVLVTRDPRRWWRSLGVLGRNATRWYLPYLTAPVPGWRWIPVLIRQYAESGRDLLGLRPGEADVGDNRGPELIVHYNQLVRDQVPRHQLLEMDLKEGWAPLSQFLGRPVPDAPFPRANDREALERVAKEVFVKCVLVWLTIFAGAGVGLCSGFLLWRRL